MSNSRFLTRFTPTKSLGMGTSTAPPTNKRLSFKKNTCLSLGNGDGNSEGVLMEKHPLRPGPEADGSLSCVLAKEVLGLGVWLALGPDNVGSQMKISSDQKPTNIDISPNCFHPPPPVQDTNMLQECAIHVGGV